MRLTLRAWLAVILVTILVAALTWSTLQVGLHLWQDHQDHHLVLDLLRVNLQQGRLIPLTVAPPVAPAPPKPEGK